MNEINKAIELNPDFYGYHFFKGNVYYFLNQYDKAIQLYDHSLSLNQNNADAYYMRGLAGEGKKLYNQALEDYTVAISYNNTDGLYYFRRGHVKYALGKRAEACEDWYEAGFLGFYEDFEKIKSVCEEFNK